MQKNTMKAKELTSHIQHLVGRMQVQKFHSPVCENIIDVLANWEFDVLSFSKSNFLYEFEVKVSRADFNNDLKNKNSQIKLSKDGPCLTKHQVYAHPEHVKRTPNYYSYVCPAGLIKENELGSAIGLFYVAGDEIECIRSPKLLHKHLHNRLAIAERVLRLTSERLFLNGARMTVKNRESDAIFYKSEIKDLAEALRDTHRELKNLCEATCSDITKLSNNFNPGYNDLLVKKHGVIPD